jgi:hypothetical protein
MRRPLCGELDRSNVQQQTKPKQRGSWTWVIFAVAAVAVLAYGIWQSQNEGNSDNTNPPPAATPGSYKFIDVVNALEATGLDVEIIRASFDSPQLSAAGQGVEVDGAPVYLFIFAGRDPIVAREAESNNIDPANLSVTTIRGTPVVEGELHVVSGSNVIAVMPSASQEITDRVDEAIEGLS